MCNFNTLAGSTNLSEILMIYIYIYICVCVYEKILRKREKLLSCIRNKI